MFRVCSECVQSVFRVRSEYVQSMFNIEVTSSPSASSVSIFGIFYLNFMLKKPCLKVQILQYKFWIENEPHPLLELFRKFIRFGRERRPLPQEEDLLGL